MAAKRKNQKLSEIYHNESEIKPVRTLIELRNLADGNELYGKLARTAAQNLGGPCGSVSQAIQYLWTVAGETTEEGVVDEINFVRGCVKRQM